MTNMDVPGALRALEARWAARDALYAEYRVPLSHAELAAIRLWRAAEALAVAAPTLVSPIRIHAATGERLR